MTAHAKGAGAAGAMPAHSGAAPAARDFCGLDMLERPDLAADARSTLAQFCRLVALTWARQGLDQAPDVDLAYFAAGMAFQARQDPLRTTRAAAATTALTLTDGAGAAVGIEGAAQEVFDMLVITGRVDASAVDDLNRWRVERPPLILDGDPRRLRLTGLLVGSRAGTDPVRVVAQLAPDGWEG